MSSEKSGPLLHDLSVVPEDIAKIRKLLDGDEVMPPGAAYPAPPYNVLHQETQEWLGHTDRTVHDVGSVSVAAQVRLRSP